MKQGSSTPRALLAALFLTLAAFAAQAAEPLKPFVLARTATGELSDIAGEVKSALQAAGFEVVGEYSPYETTRIVGFTNAAMQRNAAQSDFGAFGAVARVVVSQAGDGIQVAYTHPSYMAHVYRMDGDLADVTRQLAQALGNQQAFGPDKGLTPEQLRKYHYKWLMPYFTNRLELASYPSQERALEAVEKGLAEKRGGVSKVWRVDLPGKSETVFGVNMTEGCSGDQYLMERIDFKELKSAGHLPYEMVVSEGTVYALPAEFRIAINFPDLSMVGSNSFASIMCAPNAIETALTSAAGGARDSGW